MKWVYLVVLGILPFCLKGQEVRGRIMDKNSGEPLAFVAVIDQGTRMGAYSDIDGYYRIKVSGPGVKLSFHYTGYKPEQRTWNGESPFDITLTALAVTTTEVVVRPGVNPAERIIRTAIAQKGVNNPEQRTAFSYDSYNKLVFYPHTDSSGTAKINASDTSGLKAYFRDKHVFILESASRRRFLPPDRTEEIILASKVSGLSNPMFALLGTQIQSFSFYGETVSIFDKSYLSPLCDMGIKKYLFILEDTTYVDQDTVFTISFRPRKGKNFEGMKGQLFIHTHGYAIQQVIASPAEKDPTFDVRIRQQYQLTEGGWFPDQLNSEIWMHGLELAPGTTVYGEGRSYIRNLDYKMDMRRRDFGPVILTMDPLAHHKPDSIWDQLREHPLDEKERNTYLFLDSVGKAENLDRFTKGLGMLLTGKLAIRKVSIDLNRLVRFNSFEGWRLGAGLHTNDFMSKRFSVGGYYAYGFRDKWHKGGGDLIVHLNRQRGLQVRLAAESDVVETGGRAMDIGRQTGLMREELYPLFVKRMDRYEKKEIELKGRMIGNLSAGFFLNTQNLRPAIRDFFNAAYDGGGVSVQMNDISLTETGVQIRWAPGERLVRWGTRESRLGGKYPVIHARFTRAIDGFLGGTFEYTRLDAALEKTFRFVHAGAMTIRISSGMTDRDVPASLRYNAKGTNNIDYRSSRWLSVASPYSFETMRTNEFMHDRYLEFHLRHTFRDLLLKTEKFKPLISVVHNMMWGEVREEGPYVIVADEAGRPFLESGLVIDRLLTSFVSQTGIGVFYRYGPHRFDKGIENLAVKLSVSLSF